MGNFSLTQISNYSAAISTLIAVFGVNLLPADIEATARVIMGIWSLISIIGSFIGRFRLGDLKLSGIRK